MRANEKWHKLIWTEWRHRRTFRPSLNSQASSYLGCPLCLCLRAITCGIVTGRVSVARPIRSILEPGWITTTKLLCICCKRGINEEREVISVVNQKYLDTWTLYSYVTQNILQHSCSAITASTLLKRLSTWFWSMAAETYSFLATRASSVRSTTDVGWWGQRCWVGFRWGICVSQLPTSEISTSRDPNAWFAHQPNNNT